MNLSNKRWHVRWFHFVQRGFGNPYKYENGTTLCHFIRVTLIWGPLMILIISVMACVVVVAIVGALIVLPYDMWGWSGLLVPWMFGISLVGAFFFTTRLLPLLLGRAIICLLTGIALTWFFLLSTGQRAEASGFQVVSGSAIFNPLHARSFAGPSPAEAVRAQFIHEIVVAKAAIEPAVISPQNLGPIAFFQRRCHCQPFVGRDFWVRLDNRVDIETIRKLVAGLFRQFVPDSPAVQYFDWKSSGLSEIGNLYSDDGALLYFLGVSELIDSVREIFRPNPDQREFQSDGGASAAISSAGRFFGHGYLVFSSSPEFQSRPRQPASDDDKAIRKENKGDIRSFRLASELDYPTVGFSAFIGGLLIAIWMVWRGARVIEHQRNKGIAYISLGIFSAALGAVLFPIICIIGASDTEIGRDRAVLFDRTISVSHINIGAA